MEQTKLKYLENTYLMQDSAKVLKIDKDESNKSYIVLDQSIFYPQGGGQPYDTGSIISNNTKFYVSEVRFIDGYTCHYGQFNQESLNVGDIVELDVNEERRMLNARLHSAGHLLDYVFQELGGNLTPLKGFHFPEGPYVEYIGEFKGNTEEFIKVLENQINQYIQIGYQVKSEIVSGMEELKAKSYFIPQHIPENKPIRVVTVYGDKGVPCGGTHVKNIKEIGVVTIRKIQSKGGNTKISYQIS